MVTPEIDSPQEHFYLFWCNLSCFLWIVWPWPCVSFKPFLGEPESCFVPEYKLQELVAFVAEKKDTVGKGIKLHFVFYYCKKSSGSFSEICCFWPYIDFCFLKPELFLERKMLEILLSTISGAVRHQHNNWLYLPTIEEPLRKMRKHFLGSSR